MAKNKMIENIKKIDNERQLNEMEMAITEQHTVLFNELTSGLISMEDYKNLIEKNDRIYDAILLQKRKIFNKAIEEKMKNIIGEN